MSQEKIDIFDESYNHIGVEYKDLAHEKGLWHKTIRCWIINPDKKTIIFQLRSSKKDTFPNKLDISAGGHIKAGEAIIDCVIREIKEEIGLKIKADDLIYLGKDFTLNKNNNVIDKEFHETYFLKNKTPLSEYIMQPNEVDGVFEIKIKDGLNFFSQKRKKVKIKSISRITRERIVKKVDYNDFADHNTKYYLKIFIMAERALKNKKIAI